MNVGLDLEITEVYEIVIWRLWKVVLQIVIKVSINIVIVESSPRYVMLLLLYRSQNTFSSY